MTHLETQKLNVSYGERPALKNVTVKIPDNGITVVIGSSGCGKTTFLKCLNRLIDLTDNVHVSGKVLVDGANIFDRGVDVIELRKKMGLLMQRPFPLPMSIYKNVTYGPKINGVKDKRVLARMAEENLKIAGLWDEVKDRLDSPASRLSVGQQQRLCLARCLAVKPEIILADEPTSALDPVSSRLVEQRLTELKKDYTIIVVTHNLRQAKRIGDYALYFYMGELVEHGPAKSIFSRPKHKKTVEYVSGVIS